MTSIVHEARLLGIHPTKLVTDLPTSQVILFIGSTKIYGAITDLWYDVNKLDLRGVYVPISWNQVNEKLVRAAVGSLLREVGRTVDGKVVQGSTGMPDFAIEIMCQLQGKPL